MGSSSNWDQRDLFPVSDIGLTSVVSGPEVGGIKHLRALTRVSVCRVTALCAHIMSPALVSKIGEKFAKMFKSFYKCQIRKLTPDLKEK